MNNIKYIVLAFIAIISIASCKKKADPPAAVTPDPTPTSAKVTFQFINRVGSQDIELGKMAYMNAAGNMFQIDLLKYYVTNIILVKSDNTEVPLVNYDLIDAADSASCFIDAGSIANGTYTKIKFNIGIPVSRNHTGAQDGDLDPVMGMIWDWNTGYVFFKHEGKYKNSSNVEKPLAFHLATDRAFNSIEVPLTTNLKVEGKAKKVSLIFDLNALYSKPVNMDFNVDNSHQSSSAADYQWIDNMKIGFASAFTFFNVE